MSFMPDFFRSQKRDAQKLAKTENRTSPSEDDAKFNSFIAWSIAWMMSAPHPQRFNPNAVAQKVLKFLRGALERQPFSKDLAREIFHSGMSDGDIELTRFYLQQFLPTQREFDKTHPKKDWLQNIVSSTMETSAETGNYLIAMHALVQMLFWQAHVAVTKYPHLETNRALAPLYKEFSSAAEILAQQQAAIAESVFKDVAR